MPFRHSVTLSLIHRHCVIPSLYNFYNVSFLHLSSFFTVLLLRRIVYLACEINQSPRHATSLAFVPTSVRHWDFCNSCDAALFDVSRIDRLIDIGGDSVAAAAADVGKGGNDENDEKQALLQRQRMLNRREPTGDAFTDYIQPTTAEFFGALLLIYVVVVSQLSPSAIVRGAAHGLTLGALMLCFLDIRYW